MFGKHEPIRMIASIRAMRLDNIIVDGLIVPTGWLAENGIQVLVTHELSSFKEDGSIAAAGESYHNLVRFTSENGLNERRIFHLPGFSRESWPQSTVDAEVYSMLEKNERLMALKHQREEKQIAAQHDHESRMQKRDLLIELFFSQHGEKAVSFRKGQIVATRDGLIWKISSKMQEDGVDLSSIGGSEKGCRNVSFDTILISVNDKIMREFKSMLRNMSY